jgi:hypothetical protein
VERLQVLNGIFVEAEKRTVLGFSVFVARTCGRNFSSANSASVGTLFFSNMPTSPLAKATAGEVLGYRRSSRRIGTLRRLQHLPLWTGKQDSEALEASRIARFVIYDFRHTRVTRWSKVLPLPIFQRLAGHTDIVTTLRYVHISDADVLAAMAKEHEVQGRHTEENDDSARTQTTSVTALN